MEKIKEIIRSNGMSTRPEYYSGRGATLSDLNVNILEGIYQGILKEYSKDAAKNFVLMVADIKVLSATTFLIELFNLFYANWKYVEKEKHADGIAIPKNDEGEYDENSMLMGMIGVISAMSSNGRDDTERIRGGFLRSHGIKLEDERNYIVWEE
jgi:hypothetical protein